MAFITVRFGDDEEEIFNPNCVTLNLMDNIRRRCRCQRGVILDLSDEDGELKNLPENSNQYAHTFLRGRQSFVLIKVEKGLGADSPATYTSLLNDLETINPKLLARLEALSKSAADGKPKSGRKESMWTAASRMRKSRAQGGPTSAGQTRNESNLTNSTQNKTRAKKISKP